MVAKWKKIGEEKIIAKGYGKNFFSQHYEHPVSGEDLEFFMWGSNLIASIVLPVTTDGNVILIRSFRNGADDVLLELPGGCRDEENETWEIVAKRELLQETGYQAETLIPLCEEGLWFEPANLRVPYYPFLAIGCECVNSQELDETELIEVVSLPLSEWLDMVFSGKIRDSKSIAVTALAMKHLNI